MELLYVNACLRGKEISRTAALCQAFLEEAQGANPGLHVREHDLGQMALTPITAPLLEEKEKLVDEEKWDAPLLRPGLELAQADAVLIGAPYWDLSFPSVLKIWVENVYVRNLTFRYTQAGEPQGLCRGQRAIYIATAGSPVGENDWGAGYLRAVLHTLGIPEFTSICAEGIDIDAWDKEAILRQAEEKAREIGRSFGLWSREEGNP